MRANSGSWRPASTLAIWRALPKSLSVAICGRSLPVIFPMLLSLIVRPLKERRQRTARYSSSPRKPKATSLYRATRCVRAVERQRKRQTFPSWAHCACPQRLARCWTISCQAEAGAPSPARFLAKEIETHLEKLLRRSGEDELNRLRDEARRLAPTLGREKEFTALNAMIGALLNTQTDRLQTPAARARRRGLPTRSNAHGYVRGASRRASSHAAPHSARRPERRNDVALLRGLLFELHRRHRIHGRGLHPTRRMSLRICRAQRDKLRTSRFGSSPIMNKPDGTITISGSGHPRIFGNLTLKTR